MLFPTVTGKPVYPNGFPISARYYKIQGESIRDIFLRNCDDKATDEEKQCLKEYVLYYYHAPCFELNELKAKDLQSMSLYDLIFEGIEYGIDPF